MIKTYKTLSQLLPRPKSRLALEPSKVSGPPSHVHLVTNREMCGSFRKSDIIQNKLYTKLQLHSRTVGHLSAVYCMLFDQFGR